VPFPNAHPTHPHQSCNVSNPDNPPRLPAGFQRDKSLDDELRPISSSMVGMQASRPANGVNGKPDPQSSQRASNFAFCEPPHLKISEGDIVVMSLLMESSGSCLYDTIRSTTYYNRPREKSMSDILSSAFAPIAVEALIATPIILVGVLLIYATAAALLYYGYKRARERGFRTPGAIALVAIFWMLSLALASAISFLVSEDYQIFLWILMLLLIIPAFTLLLRVLPTRSARVFGKRHVRVPFTLLGTVVILVGCVLFGAGVYKGYNWWIGVVSLKWNTLVKLTLWAAFGALAGSYMIRLGHRLKSPQVPTAVLPGHNEPVGALYLRSFRQESQYFVYGDREKYGAYAKNFRASVTALFGWNIGVRFDEYFRPAVTSSAGPFVALGNPVLHSARRGVSTVC
jgi:hypothetical protein